MIDCSLVLAGVKSKGLTIMKITYPKRAAESGVHQPVMKVKLHAQDIIALLRSGLSVRGGAGNVPRPR